MIYNFIYVPIDSYKRNYVVLCKQDLFGYNIVRRNRSKNKNKIKSYILRCRKFKANKIICPTCLVWFQAMAPR